jgi:tetratricopeptide (TPR) repeat protein
LAELARDHLPFADVYGMLGVIYHQKGRVKDAQKMLEEALRLNPGYTEAALNLAVTYNELGRYQEAKDVYQRMMATRKSAPADLDPYVRGKIANMHAEVGNAYDQAGLFEEAAREYERALDLCPSYLDIRTRLGSSYRAAGNLKAAERELKTVMGENPSLKGPRLQLGMTYYSAGQHGEARVEWERVLAMDPDNKVARLYLRLLAYGSPADSRSTR